MCVWKQKFADLKICIYVYKILKIYIMSHKYNVEELITDRTVDSKIVNTIFYIK